MKYQSPIYLVADRYLDPESVNATTLKRWRKELLLRFNFSATPTIKIEGKEYDKQAVNDTFDKLQKDFSFHLKLYQNKALLAFIEKGNLGFFTDARAQSIFSDAVFQDKVYHLFSQAYGQVFTDAVSHPTEENINRLSILNNSPLAITSEAASEVYAESFSQFEQFISRFKDESAECFAKTSQYRLKAEIKEYVNPQIRKLLGLLPSVFDGLKKDYARLLHNNLLMQAIGKGRAKYLKNYDKPSLQTLLLAAEMDKEILALPQVDEIIVLLRRALNGTFSSSSSSSTKRKTTAAKRPTSSTSSSAGPTIWTIVIALIFLLRLGVAAERCGRSNSSSNSGYNLERTEHQEYEELMRQYRARQRRQEQETNRTERVAEEVDNSTNSSSNSRRQTQSINPKPVKVEEVKPEPKPAPKIVRKEFRQSDLFGSWVTFRLTDDDAKVNYKYNIINPTRGERVITYSDKEKDVRYSVKQPFIYKLTVDKWNTGRIYMTMQSSKPINCTKVEADTLLRIAERQIGVAVGGFNKTTTFDYLIHTNRTAGLRFNTENYRPSADIDDLGLFANDDRRSQFMVGYVNNLLERNGVSIGRDPMALRWYTENTGDYWMVKRKSTKYQVAEIVLSKKKMYFKPVHFTPEDSEIQPVFWVRNVYFIDARGRKKQGDLRVTYHRKKDYFSIKTEVI